MNFPEHEGVWDTNRAGHLISVLLKHVEVGFRDRGRTWHSLVRWASEGDVEVLFVTSDVIQGWRVTCVTNLKPFAATRQNNDYVASINLGNGAQICFKWKESLLLVFFATEHGVGLVVLHDTMAGVINEVESGLLTAPGFLDVCDDVFKLLLPLLCLFVEYKLAVALLEADAFEAFHHVFLVFEHVGQISEALELFNFTQLLILLIKEEFSLQMNWLERFGHI